MIETSPQSYDVNVHPQKLEVRFANENAVYSLVYHGCENALLGQSMIRSFEPGFRERRHEINQVSKQEEIQVTPNIKTGRTVYFLKLSKKAFRRKTPGWRAAKVYRKISKPALVNKEETDDAEKGLNKEERISEDVKPFRDSGPAVSENPAEERKQPSSARLLIRIFCFKEAIICIL